MPTARKPPNTLWPKEAAAELGIGVRVLLKKMRVIGWLHIDRNGDYIGSRHNTPTDYAKKQGFVIGLDSSYLTKGEHPVERFTTRPVITVGGFEILEGVIKRGEAPPQTPKNNVAKLEKPKPPEPPKTNKADAQQIFANIRKELQL